MPSDESKGSQLDAIGSLAQRQLDNTSRARDRRARKKYYAGGGINSKGVRTCADDKSGSGFWSWKSSGPRQGPRQLDAIGSLAQRQLDNTSRQQ